jgi:hypothetical protein
LKANIKSPLAVMQTNPARTLQIQVQTLLLPEKQNSFD